MNDERRTADDGRRTTDDERPTADDGRDQQYASHCKYTERVLVPPILSMPHLDLNPIGHAISLCLPPHPHCKYAWRAYW